MISNNRLFDDLYDNILDLRSISNVKNVLWKSVMKQNPVCKKKCAKNIKILILNTPCHGFGDLIFAIKLSKYLREWYGGTIKIASTLPEGLIELGEKPSNVISLLTRTGNRKQCRRFSHLKPDVNLCGYDLYLVAPVTVDFDANLGDVKKIVPDSTRINTYFFSEYNDNLRKNFDFNTGIGKNRDGLLLTKTYNYKVRPRGLRNPYTLIYISRSIKGFRKCVFSFLEMICCKYQSKYKVLDIVIPPWIGGDKLLLEDVSKLRRFYPNIFWKEKGEKKYIISSDRNSKRKLTLRGDILPVSNKNMIRIMKFSIQDVLLTGDQSITDMLSCCNKKNIFYQIAPWKEDFGKNLAILLPNSYLKRVNTSCGTLKAVEYKSSYQRFVDKWDFRRIGKKKLDSIVLGLKSAKRDGDIKYILDLIVKTRKLSVLKRKVKEFV